MQTLRIASAALNQTPLDWAGNQRNIESAVEAARDQGAALLCLPELCMTGYGCEDAFLGMGVAERALEMLAALEPQTHGLAVCVGLPVLHRGGLYNAAAFVVDGALHGIVAKAHLAGDGLHYEPRWFKPWPVGKRITLDVNGKQVPFGDLFFDVGGVRVGFEICEDAWVASRRAAAFGRSVDVVLNPSASHFAFGKQAVRRRIVLEGSRSMFVTYVYANLLGNEAGRIIYDGGCLIAQDGKMLAESERLVLDQVSLVSAVVDIHASRRAQASSASYDADEHPDGSACVDVAFSLPTSAPSQPVSNIAAWETSAHHKEEEFARAISLALFDYARKSRAQGYVVSISGGADSAAVSVLVSLAVQRVLREQGAALLRAWVQDPPEIDTAQAWVQRLLTCVYQATAHSGPVTERAAQAVAEELGAVFHRFDVQPMVEAYETMVAQALGIDLSWEAHDLARQNIQARVRGPGVWMVANLKRALLLATSNRSEAAVGYATMDGDTCGGISPIAGIDKAFLRQWLKWMEMEGPLGYGPVKTLSLVNAQQPTAELRPASEGQTDEADLMPYPVLDAIERLAIRDKRPPAECLDWLRAQYPAASEEELRAWVTRFFSLWSRNQWKRERYAPCFHVDDENLDPKTWCRFPILSGGFRAELSELVP